MSLAVCLSVIAVLVFVLYKRWSKIFNHWNERGLEYRKPNFLTGNLWQQIIKKKSVGEILIDLGREFKNESLFGFYMFSKPCVVINDVKYAEIVMVKEFSRFMDRGEVLKLEDMRPLDKHLFGLTGTNWKAVRSKMSPVFTSGKLKVMLPLMDKTFEKSSSIINSSLGRPIEMKDITELYSMCVRASCVFGQDTSTMTLSSTFMQKIKSLSEFTFFRFIGSSVALWFPKLAAKLNLSFFGAQNEAYFVDVLLNAFKERSEQGVVKNDLLQLLFELKRSGKVTIKQWDREDEFLKMDEKHMTTDTVVIDDDILLSQSFIFLLAGLETTLTTIVLALVELSRNRDALDKLRNEIDTVIGKHQEFSYQALQEMKYLDLCIKETMRLHPTVEFLTRMCRKPYVFDNGFTVKSGDTVIIPVFKYHMDSQYYPDPTCFNPERFENVELTPCSYLPFGEGPRVCIGMRFAMLEIKMFLSKMIYNYDFKLDSKTQLPVLNDKWFFLKRIVSPVYLNFNKRTH